MVKTIEFRRHAARAKEADELTPEGRAQAEDVGRALPGGYAVMFVSPAKRAAETAAYFLRGARIPLPPHSVVTGLSSDDQARWRDAAKAVGSSRIDAIASHDPELVEEEGLRLESVVAEMFERVPEGGRALAVGHTPIIEAAVYRLTGLVLEPLDECEGVAVSLKDDGSHEAKELRLG